MRHVLGLDLDGVCADYVSGLRHRVSDITGEPVASYTHETDWNFEAWGIDTETFFEAHERMVECGDFRWLPRVPFASICLREIHKHMGIRVVTSRSFRPDRHRAVAGDTAYWLHDNRIPYDELCFVKDKTDVVCSVYIDDAPHNIRKLQKAGREVVIFDQPWNQGVPGVRARGWYEARDRILDSL